MSEGLLATLTLAAMALEMNRTQWAGVQSTAQRNEQQLSQQYLDEGGRRRRKGRERNVHKQRKGRKMKTSTNSSMKF